MTMERRGIMKRLIAGGIILLPILFGACKKEKPFVQPDFILKKWALATEKRNYRSYRECEAYPKESEVFRTIYEDFYFKDMEVLKIEDLDEDDLTTDVEGNTFIKRSVTFQCLEVKRRDGRVVQPIQGDILFIRFTEEPRSKEGWLMSNRTLVRIK